MTSEILSITKMSKTYRITLPSEARKTINVKRGEKAAVHKIDDEIIIRKA